MQSHMILANKYAIWWDTSTKIVHNDYTQEIDPSAIYNFNKTMSFFAADTIEEIEEKITELELIIEVKADDEEDD